jgi:hypothetical protein
MPKENDPFLENIIDYAGTFPPAALSGADAFQRFTRYINGSEGWIINSLAWSVQSLGELAGYVNDQEVGVSAIGRPSTDWNSWQDARLQDIEDMNQFLEKCPNAVIETYESRLSDVEMTETALRSLKKISDETSVVIELPWESDLSDALVLLAESDFPTLKIRTGGLVESAFPSTERLAEILHEAINLEIPFKLTAGLHEPIAHEYHHGFLNVLAALALGLRDDATVGEMTAILGIKNPSKWKIDDGISVGDVRLSAVDLDSARAYFGSFGSCSVDEPLDGIAKLKGD